MPPRRDPAVRLRDFARQLRGNMTDAERHVWTRLRKHRLERFRFRRQYPLAGYIVDFYCVKARLAVELDGGQHLDADAMSYDEARDRKLAAAGIRVLRFPSDVALRDTDLVLEKIYDALTSTGPHPSPPPEYRGRE